MKKELQMANEVDIQNEAQEVKVKPEINLSVDLVTAINLTAMEYDKKITEAEVVVADLKKQKSAYIYDSNVQALINQSKQQQNSAQGTDTVSASEPMAQPVS